jgi:FkbM family methyltransferase
MKIFLQLLEQMAILFVKIVPFKALSWLLKFLPSSVMARLISTFKLQKIFNVSLFEKEFLLESGPRDDHYLDLEKDGLRSWEHEALAIWASEAKQAEIAVDIGAYLGVYSILAAKLGCRKILAIEPNSSNFSQLQRNLYLNGLSDSVQTHQVALGSESKSVSIITPRGRPNSSGSQIENSPTGRELGSWVVESEVKMVTLDSLLREETARISLVKIDAEGFELFILQGARETLESSGPAIIIELLNQEKKNEADNFLEEFGYLKGTPIENTSSCTNFFFHKPARFRTI